MRWGIRCLLIAFSLCATAVAQPQLRTDTLVLHFAWDHSNIRPADSPLAATVLRPVDSVHYSVLPDSIVILGYTDTTGPARYNDRLSLRRAEATAALLHRGTPDLPIRIEGRGEADAIPGDDSASRRTLIIAFRHPLPPPPVAARLDTPEEPEPDTVFELSDIRFHANTDILTDEARLVLPKHIDYLMTLKDRYLEVDGYCNSPGPPLPVTDPLYILSVKRAKFIYDQLVERGFDSNRIVYKGKGNTNPRNAHPTTRGEMDQNMRVEIRVYNKKPEP
jgi:outer membrane protein OmpA-like peptidoglycan-associated protein